MKTAVLLMSGFLVGYGVATFRADIVIRKASIEIEKLTSMAMAALTSTRGESRQ